MRNNSEVTTDPGVIETNATSSSHNSDNDSNTENSMMIYMLKCVNDFETLFSLIFNKIISPKKFKLLIHYVSNTQSRPTNKPLIYRKNVKI